MASAAVGMISSLTTACKDKVYVTEPPITVTDTVIPKGGGGSAIFLTIVTTVVNIQVACVNNQTAPTSMQIVIVTNATGVSFVSSNPAIATVSSTGLVTAVSAGTTTVTVAAVGVVSSQTITINVAACTTPAHVDTTIAGGTALTIGLCAGSGFPTSAAIANIVTNPAGLPLTYTSNNPNVASVTSSGVVVGVSADTTSIKVAIAGKPSVFVNVPVRVVACPTVQTISITPVTGWVYCVGTNVTQPPALVVNGLLAGQTVTWTSSNTSVATINSTTGVPTLHSIGQVTFTATVNGTNPPVTASTTTTIQGCGTGSGGGALPKLVLGPSTTKTLCPGESWQVTVTEVNADGSTISNPAVNFTAVPAGIVSIGPNPGLLNWKAVGTTTVFASAQSNASIVSSDSIVVTDIPTCPVSNPVISVGITPAGGTITVGQNQKFVAIVNVKTGVTDTTVKWSVRSPSVGTIDQNGNFSAIAAGTDTVYATANADGTTSTHVTVTVQAVPQPTVSVTGPGVANGSMSLKVGANATLSATISNPPAGATVMWTSSHLELVTVNPATGYIVGISPGTSQLCAVMTVNNVADNNVQGCINVTVTQ